MDRLQLHQILVDIIKPSLPEGATTDQVYFQPPESLVMEYPCIRYKRDKIDSTCADDKTYGNSTRYQVTLICNDPDSPLVQKILGLPMCTHQRNFAVNGLNHDVYELYY